MLLESGANPKTRQIDADWSSPPIVTCGGSIGYFAAAFVIVFGMAMIKRSKLMGGLINAGGKSVTLHRNGGRVCGPHFFFDGWSASLSKGSAGNHAAHQRFTDIKGRQANSS